MTILRRKPESFPGIIDTSNISKPRFRNTGGESRKGTPLGDHSLKVKREELTEEEKLFGARSDKRQEDNTARMSERRVNGKSAPSTISAEPVAVAEKKDSAKAIDYKVDDSGVKEFGGAIGTFFAMFFFPLIMWYLWIGQAYYNAQLPWPEKGESLDHFWWKMVGYVMEVCETLIPKALDFSDDELNVFREHFLRGKHGPFIGDFSSGKPSSTLSYLEFGSRGHQCLTGATSVWITTAMQFGLCMRPSQRLACCISPEFFRYTLSLTNLVHY